MNLIKWIPNRSAISMLNEFKYLFDGTSNDDFQINDSWSPSFNVSENDGQYIIYADLPGVEKKNVSVEIEDRVVSITGERLLDSDEINTYYTNRKFGKFCRSFNLPDNANEEEISARIRNGVLELSIPKIKRVCNIKKVKIK